MKNKNNDNWMSLLSDLGLAAPDEVAPAEEVQPESVVESVPPEPVEESKTPVEPPKPGDSFGAGLLDDLPVPPPRKPVAKPDRKGTIAEEPAVTDSTATEFAMERPEKSRSGKKSFFDRFPKMNLFGAPPKESLESVVEGSKKSPSLGGKSFTSNTLEKVPHAKTRGSRKKEESKTEDELKAGPVEDGSAERKASSKDHVADEAAANPWSAIAAQVGAISEATPETEPEAQKEAGRDRGRNSNRDRDRRGGRKTPSMFDAPASTAPLETDESSTLKNLMDRNDPQDAEAERRLSSIFGSTSKSDEKEKTFEKDDPPRRGRRGTRYEERQTESLDEESVDDLFDRFHEKDVVEETPKRGSKASADEVRGRRGSRYAEQTPEPSPKRTMPRESRRSNEEPKPDRRESAWDLDEPAEPRQRDRQENNRQDNNRQESRRAEKTRTGRVDSRAAEREVVDPSLVPVQKSVPSWDDAIGAIIDGNIARHNQNQRPRKNGGRR